MALMPPLLPMILRVGADGVVADAPVIDSVSIWITLNRSSINGLYLAEPLHKTPSEVLIVGIDLSSALGSGEIVSGSISYITGHGLTFDYSVSILAGLQSIAFRLSGGRRNTRHVIALTTVTADETLKTYLPVEVVR